MIRKLEVKGLNNRLDGAWEFNEDLNVITGRNWLWQNNATEADLVLNQWKYWASYFRYSLPVCFN